MGSDPFTRNVIFLVYIRQFVFKNKYILTRKLARAIIGCTWNKYQEQRCYPGWEMVMTISDRIFDRLKQLGMTQRTFSENTGISQSTISEWKSKGTNPTSEKIMVICKELKVTPEWLLSGIEKTGVRGNALDWYVIDKETEMGEIIKNYHSMDDKQRERLMGYMEAIMSLKMEE